MLLLMLQTKCQARRLTMLISAMILLWLDILALVTLEPFSAITEDWPSFLGLL
jgi:hypothetical protein